MYPRKGQALLHRQGEEEGGETRQGFQTKLPPSRESQLRGAAKPLCFVPEAPKRIKSTKFIKQKNGNRCFLRRTSLLAQPGRASLQGSPAALLQGEEGAVRARRQRCPNVRNTHRPPASDGGGTASTYFCRNRPWACATPACRAHLQPGERGEGLRSSSCSGTRAGEPAQARQRSRGPALSLCCSSQLTT